jgi:hypothetical protein
MTHLPHPARGGLFSGYTELDAILQGKKPVFEPAVLKSGTNFGAFTVLGRITVGAATAAAKSGGNTGNGTFTIDATTPTLAGAKVGVYQLRCVAVAVASNNDGLFELRDPDGHTVGVFAIPTGGGGSVTIADQIKGALVDGSTNFIIGDGFDITVPAGSLKYTTSLSAAIDGSQVPCAILGEPVDATSADKSCPVMVEGMFNEEALIYGTGHTADTVRVALRNVGIHLKTMRYSG